MLTDVGCFGVYILKGERGERFGDAWALKC